jgi:hypothetical protein
MKVHIYKNLFGFSKFLVCINKKEIFINNSFENIDIALVCLEKNSINRKEIWLNKIKSTLILEQDLNNYISIHKKNLEKIKQKLEEKKLDYSWLQIMQLSILNEENDNLDSNIINLKNFYNQNIIKEINI